MSTLRIGVPSLVLAGLVACALTGCEQDRSVSVASATAVAPLGGFASSAPARAIASLIDQGKFAAAEAVLREELRDHPRDAGVHAQFARYLVLTNDPSYPRFVQSPYFSDARILALGVARRALHTASELDPGRRSELAATVLSAFERRAREAAAAGRGCIGEVRALENVETGEQGFYDGINTSMIEVCWDAMALDPQRARAFAPAMLELASTYARLGKPASAMMFGNLGGDLAQGGVGTRDFVEANRWFLASLEHAGDDDVRTWGALAANAYPTLFRDELLALRRGGEVVDPRFETLVGALARYDIGIGEPRAIADATGAHP